MIKAIFFDVDGVIIRKHGYFSDRLAKEQGISKKSIMEFFNEGFKLCSLGKADLKEELAKYIGPWGWKGSIDELLKYWFNGEREIDAEIVSSIDKFRKQGIPCYLATNQEKYRKKFLLENLGLENHFDGCFASCDLGHSKKEKEFYGEVFKKLYGVSPDEIIFWDSDQKIVDVATGVGIKGRLFTGLSEFRKEMAEIS
jgi:putative hydrolase of the HAD superfamily